MDDGSKEDVGRVDEILGNIDEEWVVNKTGVDDIGGLFLGIGLYRVDLGIGID